MILDNPEFVRHRRVWLRRPVLSGIIILVIALLITFVCYVQEENSYNKTFSTKGFGNAVFLIFYILSNLVFVFFNGVICLRSVASEMEHKTYDFQRTNLLKPHELVIGKLFGAPIFGHFIILIGLPFIMAGGILAEIPFLNIIGLIAIMYLFGIFCNLLCLLFSFYLMSNYYIVFSAFGFLFFYFIVTTGFSLMGNFAFVSPVETMASLAGQESYNISFYGYLFNGVFFSMFCYLYLIYWLGLGLISMAKKTKYRYTVVSLILFLASFQILVLGLLWFKHTMVYQEYYYMEDSMESIAKGFFGIFMFFLYALYLMIDKPIEQMHKWLRERPGNTFSSIFNEDFPAIITTNLGSVAAVLLFLSVSLFREKPAQIFLIILFFMLFVARETLYLSLMKLKGIRTSIALMYLVIFYILASAVTGIIKSDLLFTVFPGAYLGADFSTANLILVLGTVTIEVIVLMAMYLISISRIRKMHTVG